MLGVRGKLSLGFGGLLLVIVVIGVQSIWLLTSLGHSIDVILRENYRSVVACQQMKEALEGMDSGVSFSLLGETERGRVLISGNEELFEEALRAELNNITLDGEDILAVRLADLFLQYRTTLHEVQEASGSLEERTGVYFSRLLPLFQQIKETADEVLHMNQQNMITANVRARSVAAEAKKRMLLLLLCGAAVAVGFILFTGRWILRPINRLTRSADEIRRGNLELVVQSDSRDEIGRLSEAFNEMASSLRESRRSDRSRMNRIQHSTRQVFRSLPDAVAVVDLEGSVDVATESASEIFGLRPDVRLSTLPFDWMTTLFEEAIKPVRMVDGHGSQVVIQWFVHGKEHFFRPEAVPILDHERQLSGVILVLKDVTLELQQEELKRGVIATVSHQLKTPLTSLRMAVYLLLEEKAGVLNPKQLELLVAAREESDRLHSILTSLLDMSRIESGKMQMEICPVPLREIVLEQVESCRNTAKDRGIVLIMEVPDDLPEVLADRQRIILVLENLLSNAIKYTHPGGRITVSAELRDDRVCFSVSDTGKGIPAEYLDRIFDQFFRAPDQDGEPGEGLGLAIAKEVMDAHGGALSAESQPGRGSVFTFCLKRGDIRQEEDEGHG